MKLNALTYLFIDSKVNEIRGKSSYESILGWEILGALKPKRSRLDIVCDGICAKLLAVFAAMISILLGCITGIGVGVKLSLCNAVISGGHPGMVTAILPS